MDINLEKVDIIRERTGVSYKAAKEALERADGNVVDAIIDLEDKTNKKWTDNMGVVSNDVMEKIKKVIKKGNVTKILLKKGDETIMNIPVTAGAVGVVLAPIASVIGVSAALATRIKIEIVKDTGEVMDINEMAEDTATEFKSKVMGNEKDDDPDDDLFVEDFDEKLSDLDDGTDF